MSGGEPGDGTEGSDGADGAGSAEGEDYLDRLVDEDALAAYLERELGPAEGLAIEYHQAGHSNETLFVDWGDRELVLRRPPAGAHADAAHEVLREYRAMDALQDTAVPVPTTVAGCDDHGVIGSDFYLMERLEGDVIRDEEPDRFGDPGIRRELSEVFIDTVAEIHSVDPAAVGLGDWGHPEGYTARQVDIWTQQLEWAFEVTAEERAVPDLLEVADWLADNVPDSYDHTLVHGDYKLDNVMFGPGLPPEIVGVFDWEMCTRGDPLMDLGWMLISWTDPGDPEWEDPLSSRIEAREGYMSRRELLDRYEAKTGRPFDNDRFYRTFGVFKSAGACEMMYRRYLEGNSNNPAYPLMEERVPAIAERALGIIDGDEPL
jgi:aminoglycoside phosphotransferase (APT) family kinase protein